MGSDVGDHERPKTSSSGLYTLFKIVKTKVISQAKPVRKATVRNGIGNPEIVASAWATRAKK